MEVSWMSGPIACATKSYCSGASGEPVLISVRSTVSAWCSRGQ
jgi:hypothetical protein